jgi:hypothetical protein
MSENLGTIALMGSGELTSTMVEVHKGLLSGLAVPGYPVFLDTPAGFQLNADQLSERALDYFLSRVGSEMAVASFKSRDISPAEAEEAYRRMSRAGYILIGPGSPTYAVRQWRETPLPKILEDRIRAGACLVAASAAALTVGRFTLPVYEIYKVGMDLYWENGLDILERFGFDLVVVPHWNNAEGGTHDTRFCYMGEPRFRELEGMLPRGTAVFGLDEHTACILDLASEEAHVEGIGGVTLRLGVREFRFVKGDRFPLDVLRRPLDNESRSVSSAPGPEEDHPGEPSEGPPDPDAFWDRVHALESAFRTGLERGDTAAGSHALLELDRLIWEAYLDRENPEFISQAREILREFIVYLGLHVKTRPDGDEQRFAPLIEALLARRDKLRREERWDEADEVRAALHAAGVEITDTQEGPRWTLKTKDS